MTVYVEGVGVMGPGLAGWTQAAAALSARSPYTPAELPRLTPEMLAPDVRRRTTRHIRLALVAAEEAVRHAAVDPALLPSVFASSEADSEITHDICHEVAKAAPEVSPTRFHNSVTNAPAGYWCMAGGSMEASTSVAGFDVTFAVGLLEACAQVLTEHERVLLVAHDTRLPEPLHAQRPLLADFAAALVLARARTERALAQLDLELVPGIEGETSLADAGLEQLRRGNPAARALPLLAALAAGAGPRPLDLPYLDGLALRLGVSPCAATSAQVASR
jgi:hypothetical protein